MRISIKVEEVLPLIERHLREKYGLKNEIELTYTSKTTFLTFDTVDER